MKAATTILAILTLGLAASLFYRHTVAIKQERQLELDLAEMTRKYEDTSIARDEQERISLILRTNLNMTSQELQSLSNNYVQVTAELLRTQTDAAAAAAAAKAAEENAKVEIAKKDSEITQLQSQGDELSTKIGSLESTLNDLNQQIADTEVKLAASEGDREWLLSELKRMQSERAELERQFNDLSLLRAQVSKLKEELSISRRLEWIRMGIYGAAANKKGAELLMGGFTSQPRSNFNLNVELRQDGETKIVPPENTETPAP